MNDRRTVSVRIRIFHDRAPEFRVPEPRKRTPHTLAGVRRQIHVASVDPLVNAVFAYFFPAPRAFIGRLAATFLAPTFATGFLADLRFVMRFSFRLGLSYRATTSLATEGLRTGQENHEKLRGT
jgi:hypothetical protein